MTPATCERIGCQRHHQLKANGLDVCVLKLLIDQHSKIKPAARRYPYRPER